MMRINAKIIVSMLLLGFLFSVTNSIVADDKKGFHRSLTVDVVPDLNTLSFVDLDNSGTPSPGEPFVIEGDLFKEGVIDQASFDSASPIGKFLCRGFFIIPQDDGDVTYVHQSFEFKDQGTVHVEGNEPGKVPGIEGFSRAIVGATGRFFKTRGQAKVIPLPSDTNPLLFRILLPLNSKKNIHPH